MPASVEINVAKGLADDWVELLARKRNGGAGDAICSIERIGRTNDYFDDDISGFLDELKETRPRNASEWVSMALSRVEFIYWIQHHKLADAPEFSMVPGDLLHRISELLRFDGLIQTDLEGFSTGQGYFIVWQFSDRVTGEWNCAVLNSVGGWNKFRMDLGNRAHRQAFWAGRVPDDAVLLPD